jgi:glutamate racemase
MPAPIVIGIRDSGVGGLTVARRIREQIPGADLLYFADTAHVPYGEKTEAQIRHYALSISQFLIEQGAQMVVFACNTTSAIALETARASLTVPIYGVIEPGARLAAQVFER